MALKRGNDVSGVGVKLNHDMLLTTLEIALDQKREQIRVLMSEAHALSSGLLPLRWNEVQRQTDLASDMAQLIYTLRNMNTEERIKGFEWVSIRGFEE